MTRIVIFGAGLGGKRALNALPPEVTAIAFCDNCPALHGRKICGLPVVDPARLFELDLDYVLIASSYFDEIFDQLIAFGFPIERIEVLDPEVRNGNEESTHVRWLAFTIFSAGVASLVFLASYGTYYLLFG